jgi:hypothetical protein
MMAANAHRFPERGDDLVGEDLDLAVVIGHRREHDAGDPSLDDQRDQSFDPGGGPSSNLPVPLGSMRPMTL